LKLSSPQALLNVKLRNTFNAQKRRAREYGKELDYVLADLSALAGTAGNLGFCRYCKTRLTIATLNCDHRVAVSEGGSFSLSNLEFICKSCNTIKGRLSDVHMMGLVAFFSELPPRVVQDLSTRLKAGGAIVRGGFRRRKWKKKR
jgi:RNase P subunit RPR2